MTSPFEDVPADALVRFVAEYPLAWIIPNRAPADALLMPVLLDGPDLDTGTMLGHLPRRAPATQALQDDGCATLLFLGPNAYIPPSWISTPAAGPWLETVTSASP